MSHRLSAQSIHATCAVTRPRSPSRGRDNTNKLCGIQFITAALPRRVAVAAAMTARVLWIIIDPTKPDFRAHLVDLLEHWPTPHPRDDLRAVFFEAGYHVGTAQCPDPVPPEQGC